MDECEPRDVRRAAARRGRSRSASTLAFILGAALGPSSWAEPFNDVFIVSDSEFSSFDSGTMVYGPTGAFLVYAVVAPEGPGGPVQFVTMGARFDAAGDLRWSLRPQALREVFGDVLQEVRAIPHPGLGTSASVTPLADPDKARVLYALESGTYRFGIVDAISSSVVYAYEVAYTPPTETVYSLFGTDGIETLIHNRPDGFTLVGIDGGGGVLFDSAFTGPAFAGESAGESLLLAALSALNGTGYYVVAHVAESLPSGTLEPVPYSCVIIRLDTAGNASWARTLRRTVPEPSGDTGPDLCSSHAGAPDGSLIFTQHDSTMDPDTLVSSHRTHVIKINPDGTLGWAETFEDALLFVGTFTADGSIILGGLVASPAPILSATSAGVLARIDPASGAVMHEFRLPEADFGDVLAVAATSDSYIYAGHPVADLSRGDTVPAVALEIFRLDHSLQPDVGWRLTGNTWAFGAGAFNQGRLPVSEFDEATGEVRAFEVDENLQASAPSCSATLVSAMPITTGATGLVPTPLAVSLTNSAVAAASAATPLVPVELPVLPLSVSSADCSSSMPP